MLFTVRSPALRCARTDHFAVLKQVIQLSWMEWQSWDWVLLLALTWPRGQDHVRISHKARENGEDIRYALDAVSLQSWGVREGRGKACRLCKLSLLMPTRQTVLIGSTLTSSLTTAVTVLGPRKILVDHVIRLMTRLSIEWSPERSEVCSHWSQVMLDWDYLAR